MRHLPYDRGMLATRFTLPLFVAFAAPVAAQNTIERLVVESVSQHERVDFGPQTLSSHPGLFLDATLSAAVVPPLAGVTLISVAIDYAPRAEGFLSVYNPTSVPWDTYLRYWKWSRLLRRQLLVGAIGWRRILRLHRT